MKLGYHSSGAVGVGETARYHITYSFTPENEDDKPAEYVWLRVRNTTSNLLRPAYLNGPFILCVSVRDAEFNAYSGNADSVLYAYDPGVKTSSSFWVKLPIDKSPKTWIAEVTSQVIFSDSAKVTYTITMARTQESARALASANGSKFRSEADSLIVLEQDTKALWRVPVEALPENAGQKDVHLVVLTHGLHSNATADMLYLKDLIEDKYRTTHDPAKSIVVVRAFEGNVCKTEQGVKKLGKRLAQWMLAELGFQNSVTSPTTYAQQPRYTRLSMIGHSLGGVVQVFALGWLQAYHSYVFKHLKPEHFICLASPMLGVSSENPQYVKFALDFGLIGKSGQDLGLAWKPNGTYRSTDPGDRRVIRDHRPLLRILSLEGSPSHEIVRQFRTHTLYANAMNDGIVPLRTASLFFLDWEGLGADDEQEVAPPPQPPQQARTTHERRPSAHAWDDAVDQDFSRAMRSRSKSNPSVGDAGGEGGGGGGNSPVRARRGSTQAVPDDPSAPNLFSLLNLFKPLTGGKPSGGNGHSLKQIRRSQTVKSGAEFNGTGSSLSSAPVDIPPKAGIFESASHVIRPPLPRDEYIRDPGSRSNCVFHDRIYHPQDIPPARATTNESGDPAPGTKREKFKLEEKMARSWHADISWRKVLVKLEPDAHNNIVVRRMFPNAYGWPVVCHLVDNFFGESDSEALERDASSSSESVAAADVTRDGEYEASFYEAYEEDDASNKEDSAMSADVIQQLSETRM